MAPLRVLVIEDEAQIRRFLRSSLVAPGYELLEATGGREGIAMAAQQRPDCIILDLGLPDMEGAAVLRAIRSWSTVPIIILTARGQEQDKIALLDAGADDYLTKPFGMGELMARIRVAVRRTQPGAAAESAVVQLGDVRLDMANRQLFRGEQELHLTPIEYKLLTTLVRNRGRVMTQRQLLEAVWGAEYTDATHYLRVYMQHLRHKLEADPARSRFLLTEPGVGYRLRAEP
jgi:two-component system, OmpR family, KDP operon response regulator KdpE